MKELYRSECYCTNARRCSNMLTDFYDRSMEESGLTVAQYYLLINLSRMGSANVTHWAGRVGLERSTMVRNIKLLTSKGLIELTEGHGKTYCLTPDGKSALDRAIPIWQSTQQKIENLLGTEDAQALIRISEKLLALENMA